MPCLTPIFYNFFFFARKQELMEQQNSAVENSEDAATDVVDVVEINLTTRLLIGSQEHDQCFHGYLNRNRPKLRIQR
jgi:hypothetical protein